MKKILALLLAMMMVLSLCACGAQEEAPDEVAPIVEAAPAEAAPAEAAPAEGDASGEMGGASGEASGEVPSDVPVSASMPNEAHGGTAGATSEADYQDYLTAWLTYEKSVNTNMTDDMYGEFTALISALDFETFPGDMLFNGLLTTGAAMTYDEFVAANGLY